MGDTIFGVKCSHTGYREFKGGLVSKDIERLVSAGTHAKPKNRPLVVQVGYLPSIYSAILHYRVREVYA